VKEEIKAVLTPLAIAGACIVLAWVLVVMHAAYGVGIVDALLTANQ